MLISNFKKILTSIVISGAVVLTGCGGGGGAAGADSSSGSSSSGSSSSSSSSSTPATPTVTLTMTTTSGGATVVNSVSSGTPVYLNATVKDAAGVAVSGAVVTFTVPALAVLTPSSGTALTNGSGVASIQVDAASTSAAGAGSTSAAATWASGSTSYSQTSPPLGFAVGSATVTFGAMVVSPASISAYGSSTITLPVNVNGSPATVPISVAFTSSCVNSAKASITSPVTSVNGVVTTTYKDIASCSSTDSITASVSGTAASTSQSIIVAAPVANNIQFTSATPSVIGIAGTGLPTSSVVKFKVVDASNNGVAGKVVDITVTPTLAAGSVTLSANSATSDINGEVTVSLTSGSVPTPVWVVATLNGSPLIKSQSTALTVTTGLPSQNFFSLSVSTHNIEGLNWDGVTTTFTVYASDRLGNPVPENTAVNFVTEGGQIEGTCATSRGTCSVTLASANFKPTDGRVTVLAYVLGEKSFIDVDANNTWNAGETFYDLGDPFIDANELGSWDSGEQYFAYNAGAVACGTHANGGVPVTAYPLSYGDAPSKASTCSGTMGDGKAYVRRMAVITFSGSAASAAPASFSMGSTCKQTFGLWVNDVNNNPMPKGSALSVSNNNVTYLSSTTGLPVNPSITVNDAVVPDSIFVGGTFHTFTVEADTTTCPGGLLGQYPSGTFNFDVTTPKGTITHIPITITP